MKGLLYYYYEKGSGFIDSITAITSDDVITQIKNALDDKEHCSENVTMLLKKYADKESEAFQDIELTLQGYKSFDNASRFRETSSSSIRINVL